MKLFIFPFVTGVFSEAFANKTGDELWKKYSDGNFKDILMILFVMN